MVSLIIPVDDGVSSQIFQMPVSTLVLVLIAIVSIAIPLAFYLLRSFALYKMAKTENINKAYFAFIPFLWTYIAGKIAGTPVYFGKIVKKFPLWLCIFYTVSEGIALIFNFLVYAPVLGYLLQGGELLYVVDVTNSVINSLEGAYEFYPLAINLFVPSGNFINVPYATYEFIQIANVISYVMIPIDVAVVVLTITMYSGVFKKYWPLHYFSGIIFSIFGLFPIFAFVVRKNQPVDYNKFMRERFARQYGYYNPYASQQNNPYNQYNNANPNANKENPFNEFSEKKEKAEDPFSEFNNDKDEK